MSLTIAISGLFQKFLLTGLIWNFLFPYIQIIILALIIKSSRKSKTLIACSTIIGLLVILDFGFRIYSNTNINSSGTEKEMKIMSYNLYFKNRTPMKTISVIKKANPDILFVQELTPNWKNEINKSLGHIYKYKIIKPLTGTHGIGIYSKHKLSNQKYLNNSRKKPFAQIVDLSINKKKIQLINTHLSSPAIAVENKDNFFPLYLKNYRTRMNQVIKINELAQTEESKYNCQLLVGDLNTLYSEPIYKRIKIKWVNSFKNPFRWMDFNFPNSSRIQPVMTLDYIMGRGKLKFKNSSVINGGSSDHLPILTEIKI